MGGCSGENGSQQQGWASIVTNLVVTPSGGGILGAAPGEAAMTTTGIGPLQIIQE